METTSTEKLKGSFYGVVKGIMRQEMSISNIGVHDKFKGFVLHLERIMIQPRIINQFNLALTKYKEETGVETSHHLDKIVNWIKEQPKNY